MNIKTQSLILMLGIVLVPLAIISLFLVVERVSFKAREATIYRELRLEDGAPTSLELVKRIIGKRPAGIDAAVAVRTARSCTRRFPA